MQFLVRGGAITGVPRFPGMLLEWHYKGDEADPLLQWLGTYSVLYFIHGYAILCAFFALIQSNWLSFSKWEIGDTCADRQTDLKTAQHVQVNTLTRLLPIFKYTVVSFGKAYINCPVYNYWFSPRPAHAVYTYLGES